MKDPIAKSELHVSYKEQRNKIRDVIRQSRERFLDDFFSKNITNIKNTWKGIKSLIKMNNSNRGQPSSLMVNNKLISKPKQVAETFNEYFSSIADKLQNKIKHVDKDFSSYLKKANPFNFFIMLTNVLEVINNINDLSSNKALGPHSIPTDIFHLIKLNVAEPLPEIINLSLFITP